MKRFISVLLTALMLVGMIPVYAFADDGIILTPATLTTDKYDVTGDGAKDSVYEIGNASQLYWFAALVNGTLPNELKNPRANAVLTNDITVNSKVIDKNGELIGDGSGLFEWTPINEFRGIFDGRGYDIKGLYYNNPDHNQTGLFAYTHSGSVICNLGVTDSYFSGNQSVGPIAGQSSSTIYNCHSNSTVVADIGGGAGGIIGYQANGRVYNCYSTGLVTGYYHLGGIAGSTYRTEIADCYNSGSVVGTTADYESDAAGIVGYLNKSTLQNCYNIGTIEGYHNVAQIAAYRYNNPTVANCYYLSDTETEDGGRTAEQFASGEMTWILNGESYSGAWKQTLGQDAYPVFEGDTVYYGKLCATEEATGYTNEKAYNSEEHYDEHGYCEICGLQPALLAEDGYYEIYNKGQLYWFADFVNRYVYDDGVARVNGRLMADIVINDVPFDTEGHTFEEWTPIGYDFYNFRYGGTFDGNGHTVSGLYIVRDGYYTGFIGVLGEGGVVKNLGIINSYIDGENSVGGIAGISTSEITNCFVINTDISGISGVGGIVGARTNMNDSGASINNCFSTADAVTDGGEVGGVVSGLTPEGSYYLADAENDNGGKTEEQFKSGEVAYLLGEAWGQTIGTDVYPILGGATVYAGYDCGNTNMYYSNTPLLSEEDSYHVPSEWIPVEGESNHIRYICTREVCEFYNVTETQPCSGYAADCQNREYCITCGNEFGDYDMNNHVDSDTYYSYDEGSGTHTLYHWCCDSEIFTEEHIFDGYDFDDTDHWLTCVCGACDEIIEPHSFDDEGFCTICGGYEPAHLDEENYRYEISKAGHLFWFARSINNRNCETGDAVLTADIDLNPGYTFAEDGSYSAQDGAGELRIWTPIGDGYSYYTGAFDGRNHTISGLYINDPEADNAGLFGSTMYNYPISNIKLTNGYLRASDDVGALAAYAESIITNCHSDITVVGSGNMGGLVGYLVGGGVYESSNTGDVSFYHSASSTGGIVGNMYSGEIVNCLNTGHIIGTINTGGIAGDSSENPVANCLNLGIVESGYFSTKNQIAESFTNSYYLAVEPNDNGGRTSEQMASGEITYLLQSAQPEEDVYDEETWEYIGTVIPTVWTQTIGVDEYPTLNAEGDIVYYDAVNGYSNHAHNWKYTVNGDKISASCDAVGCTDSGCATGVLRMPYPTSAINGVIYEPDKETIDYCASKGTEFIDAETGLFLFGEDGKFLDDYTGLITYKNESRYVQNGFICWHPGFVEIEGELYYFSGDEAEGGNLPVNGDTYIVRANGVEGFAIGDVYNFENGKLSGADGIVDGKYYENSRLMLGNKLTAVEVDGETKYIYVRSAGQVVMNTHYWVGENDLNIVPGTYDFDENGYMIGVRTTDMTGVVYENGGYYFYENGVPAYKGLIKYTGTTSNGTVYDNDWIYVRSNGRLATGSYWTTKNDSGELETRNYNFDECGRMINKNGIVEENGNLYYYVNGIKQFCSGLIELDGKYYYVRTSGEVVRDREYWITNVNETGVIAQNYYFDKDGVMQDVVYSKSEVLNGVVDGYYYEDGKIAYGAGLVELDDGSIIYVRSNGKLATGIYWPTTLNGVLPAGKYDFGTDGILVA